MVHSIQVSDEVYENFLKLKDMISAMTQEEVKEEEVMSLMVEEFITSVEMMQKEWPHHAEDQECCGENDEDDCCGECDCQK